MGSEGGDQWEFCWLHKTRSVWYLEWPYNLKKWDNRNLTKWKYEVLRLGRNNPMNQHTLEASHLEHSIAAKDLGSWQTTGQQCTRAANQVSGILGYTEQRTASRMRVVFLHLHPAPVPSSQLHTCIHWKELRERLHRGMKERLRKMKLFSLGKGRVNGDSMNTWREPK